MKLPTGHVSNAELDLAENELIKSCQKKQEYQKKIPKNVKKEVSEYDLTHGTQAAIKVFSKKYPTIQFNHWKDKSKSCYENGGYKKAGRLNMLNDALLVKLKDRALSTRMS